MDTAELVLRMKNDDPEALEELMKRFHRELKRLAYLISGNYADSEDIVQETFVQAYMKRKSIREPEHFKAWLVRMMTRIAWRYLKKKSREYPSGDVLEDVNQHGLLGEGESVERAAARREEAEELYDAIRQLPVKQRTAVVLYYFENMTTREIASVSGCLEGTVKSRLYTARKTLKETLSGEYLPEERRLSV